MSKRCGTCKLIKEDSEFNKTPKRLKKVCKTCELIKEKKEQENKYKNSSYKTIVGEDGPAITYIQSKTITSGHIWQNSSCEALINKYQELSGNSFNEFLKNSSILPISSVWYVVSSTECKTIFHSVSGSNPDKVLINTKERLIIVEQDKTSANLDDGASDSTVRSLLSAVNTLQKLLPSFTVSPLLVAWGVKTKEDIHIKDKAQYFKTNQSHYTTGIEYCNTFNISYEEIKEKVSQFIPTNQKEVAKMLIRNEEAANNVESPSIMKEALLYLGLTKEYATNLLKCACDKEK